MDVTKPNIKQTKKNQGPDEDNPVTRNPNAEDVSKHTLTASASSKMLSKSQAQSHTDSEFVEL